MIGEVRGGYACKLAIDTAGTSLLVLTYMS